LILIIEVTLCEAWLVVGSMSIFGQANHLGM